MTPVQLEELQPSCMLPQNFSGTWFTSSEYDSQVKINATHIHFNTLHTSFATVSALLLDSLADQCYALLLYVISRKSLAMLFSNMSDNTNQYM